MQKPNFYGAWQTEDKCFGSFPVKDAGETFVNLSGMKMISVSPASFKMGGGDTVEHPDGLPVHVVNITKPFFIADEPVTEALFGEFCREKYGREADVESIRGYAVGVSWYEAADFCVWLSEREGVQYRLPTEAEWEYVARNALSLDVDRMCDFNIREWCYDWYDVYSDLEQTDPAGPQSAHNKVVRGGLQDCSLRYNINCVELWTRGSMAPNYRHYPDDVNNEFGRHHIGFRVVCGELPTTSKKIVTNQFCMGVHQTEKFAKIGISNDKPYFRKRFIFPIPPENASRDDISACGLTTQFRFHNHSPAFEVASNGDLLYTIYSSYHEYDAEVGLIAARLRKGCDQWEMVDMFLNPVGVNDHAPNMFRDTDGTLYHFWGWQQLDRSFPFQYVYSKDNGASWSCIQFPKFKDKAERVVRQPINTSIRAKDGTFYTASDASNGSCSVLWRSRDNLATWENPKGRSAGRHTTFVELKDGALLGMGGKNSDIDGYMPKAISRDGGDTWDVTITPFPACNSGQRPCVIRLQSGKLFMCGDYMDKQGRQPASFGNKKGCYGAWSEDEGQTWTIKKLWGTQIRERVPESFGGSHVLGYSVCRQSDDGMIHVVTSNTHPNLHFEFNENWLMNHDEDSFPSDAELMPTTATKLTGKVETIKEYYENGQIKCEWSGGIADDGRFLMDGDETFYYPNGNVMTKASFKLGQRVGEYVYYGENGLKVWQWNYNSDGSAYYTTYHEDTEDIRSRCRYYNRKADGVAQTFGRDGRAQSEVIFKEGDAVSRKDLRKEPPSPMGEIF